MLHTAINYFLQFSLPFKEKNFLWEVSFSVFGESDGKVSFRLVHVALYLNVGTTKGWEIVENEQIVIEIIELRRSSNSWALTFEGHCVW